MKYEDQLREEMKALEKGVLKPRAEKSTRRGSHVLLIFVSIFLIVTACVVFIQKASHTVRPGTYHVVSFQSGERRVVDQPQYFAILPQRMTIWPIQDHAVFESEVRLKDGVPVLVSAEVSVYLPTSNSERLEVAISYRDYMHLLNYFEAIFRMASRTVGSQFTAQSLYFGSEYWVDGDGFNVLVRNEFERILLEVDQYNSDNISYMSMIGTWSFIFDFPKGVIQKLEKEKVLEEALQKGAKNVYWNGKR